MSLLKAVIGGAVGFMVGGPLGAIVGATVAHQLGNDATPDSHADNSSQAQMAFFVASFSVMAHVAKVNGRVCPEAISYANRVITEMNLDASLRATAIDLFNQGKRVDFQLNHVLAEFHRECRQRQDLIHRFVEVQLQTATVDGTLTSKEDALLWHICAQLRVSRFHYQRVKIQLLSQQYFYQQQARSPQVRSASSLAEAYKILGLTPAANQTEVKQAYRRLMSQNHPDKLAAKGLSEATMLRAKEKTQQISKAYQTIQKSGNS